MMIHAQPFFDWLLETTVIGSVVICLILVIQKTLGGKLGPRWCHALWLVLLIRMVLPWAPSSSISLFNLIPSWDRQAQPQQQAATVQQPRPSEASQTSGAAEAIPAQKPKPDVTAQEPTTARPVTLAEPQSVSKPYLLSLYQVLPVLWLVGAVIMGIYLLASDLALWRIVKADRPLVNQAMLELFEECKTQMGIQSLVVVVPSEQVRSPGLFGFVRPRLLLPREMIETATCDEMRYVFLHELAHLKRHDIYLGWLASLLQVLHWFNPLVWFAFYRMRADRELACDALVLARTGEDESQQYGQTIIGLLRHFSRCRPLPAMAGILETKSQLKRRMTMIAKSQRPAYKMTPLAVIVMIVMGCVSVPGPKYGSRSQVSTAEHPSGMTLRKILPEDGDFANVSPDGRFLCDMDPNTGNLAIRELSTGKRWPVTDKKSWEDSKENALDGAIAPDSRRVAYLWQDDASNSSSLYIAGLDGSDRKLLCKDIYAMPRDWSADGSKILAIVYGPPHRMVWISASDGSIQQIKDIGKEYPGKYDVSPDGRFLAYDLPQAEDTKIRDVFLLDLHENHEIRLAEHPADDRLLGWTPNGKWILFASNRSDKWDAWLIGINDGKPAGLPRLVKANIGDVGAVGFASNGDYYFSIYDLRRNVYVAPFDLTKGTLLSAPSILQPTGKSSEPVWSPDGRYLAYTSSGVGETSLIKIWSPGSGQERELGPKLPRRLYSWAPDGKSLLLSGFLDESWYNTVFKLDLQTGEYSELLRHKDMSIAFAQWFPDGKRLLYHGRHGPNGASKQLGYLMIRDMDSGEEREIARGEFWKDHQWAMSPDGRQLAVKLNGDRSTIKIFSTETDEAREVLAGELAAKVHRIIWTPDGKALLLRMLDLSASRQSEIWRIAADGGTPEKLCELDIPEYVTDMRIDPTGRHIALTAITNLHELWVMENFLAQESSK